MGSLETELRSLANTIRKWTVQQIVTFSNESAQKGRNQRRRGVRRLQQDVLASSAAISEIEAYVSASPMLPPLSFHAFCKSEENYTIEVELLESDISAFIQKRGLLILNWAEHVQGNYNLPRAFLSSKKRGVEPTASGSDKRKFSRHREPPRLDSERGRISRGCLNSALPDLSASTALSNFAASDTSRRSSQNSISPQLLGETLGRSNQADVEEQKTRFSVSSTESAPTSVTKVPTIEKATPLRRSSEDGSAGVSEWTTVTQRFVEAKRATGGVFSNSSARSGSIVIEESDARRISQKFARSDAELGSELVKLLRVALGEGAEVGIDARDRLAREFRGYWAAHRSQGAYVLGGSPGVIFRGPELAMSNSRQASQNSTSPQLLGNALENSNLADMEEQKKRVSISSTESALTTATKFPKRQSVEQATPLRRSREDNSASVSEWITVTQRFVEAKRATGGVFSNSSARSGSIVIEESDARRISQKFTRSDAELGAELVKLLRVALGEGAEVGIDARDRLAREFRGYWAAHRSQGTYVLGGGGHDVTRRKPEQETPLRSNGENSGGATSSKAGQPWRGDMDEESDIQRALHASEKQLNEDNDLLFKRALDTSVHVNFQEWWNINGEKVVLAVSPHELAIHNSLATAEAEDAKRQFDSLFLPDLAAMSEEAIKRFKDWRYLLALVEKYRSEMGA